MVELVMMKKKNKRMTMIRRGVSCGALITSYITPPEKGVEHHEKVEEEESAPDVIDAPIVEEEPVIAEEEPDAVVVAVVEGLLGVEDVREAEGAQAHAGRHGEHLGEMQGRCRGDIGQM